VADAKPTWREANDPPRDEEDVDDEEECPPTTVNALGAVPACAGSNLRGLGRGHAQSGASGSPTANSRLARAPSTTHRFVGATAYRYSTRVPTTWPVALVTFTTSDPTTFAVTFIPGPLDASNGSAGPKCACAVPGACAAEGSGASNAVPRTNAPGTPVEAGANGSGFEAGWMSLG
jgi:hypothetical protein